jgi:colanic acid/amylovoran biosynthesis glycosyltransferase
MEAHPSLPEIQQLKCHAHLMPTIAYFSNLFPSPVEPYVAAEIRELRSRGVQVIPCSARRSSRSTLESPLQLMADETLYLQPLKWDIAFRAAFACLRLYPLLADLYARILTRGRETPMRRAKALLHTWLGVYYAILLKGRNVEHIHVHHGYFGSWVAMVASRVLGVGFSMTLHGSDLLLHHAYLDTKLSNCRFCLTVSAFNRWHIMQHYPSISPEKLLVQHMGVELLLEPTPPIHREPIADCMVLLSVGRLHAVKDHAFLIRACRELKNRGLNFLCLIVGDGPERSSLDRLILQLNLRQHVELLGQLPHDWVFYYYKIADLVVLTSRSEGIPLVLMEAMAHETTVLAPAITGIPELVEHGRTGFLYQPGSLEDFVTQVETIWQKRATHQPLRRAARQHVFEHYNRDNNLSAFAETFLSRIRSKANPNENPLLQ